jgi:hypothetical protein
MIENNNGPAMREHDPELRQALIDLARELTRVLRMEYGGPPVMQRRRGMPGARRGRAGAGQRQMGPPGFHPAEADDEAFGDGDR